MRFKGFHLCGTILLVSAPTAPAHARFLQTDPVGYADDVNLYSYVGNDPVNRTDPDGMTCVMVESKAQCKIDVVNRADGKALTNADRAAVRQFERRYTNAVNQLLKNPNRQVTVAAFGNPKNGSFKISAGQAAGALASREFRYSVGANAPSATTSMTTSGAYSPVYGRTMGSYTNVYDYGIKNATGGNIVHEGFHGTKQERAGGLQTPSYPLGGDRYRAPHQQPYGQAACSLLDGQDC